MARTAYPVLTSEQLTDIIYRRVEKRTASECWPWLGKSKQPAGQGLVRIDKRLMTVPRLIWTALKGPIGDRQAVYATCGDSSCCNLAHLACGTRSSAMHNRSRLGSKLGRANGYEEPPARQTRTTARPYPTLTERQIRAFWKKVIKGGPEECWYWDRGYGLFTAAGRTLRAARVSFSLAFGDPPVHLDVCHACDEPLCVNPAHLFLGNRSQNVKDSVKKGRFRAATGEDNSKTKLRPEQVQEIRQRSKAGEQNNNLAREFGITPQSLSAILVGKSWRHLPVEVASED